MTLESSPEKTTKITRSSKLVPLLILGLNLSMVLYLFFANQESRNLIGQHVKKAKEDSAIIKLKEKEIGNLQKQFKKIISENSALGLTIEGMDASLKELEKLKSELKSGKLKVRDIDKKLASIQRKYIEGRSVADSILHSNTYLTYLKDSILSANRAKEDSLLNLIENLRGKELVLENTSLEAENILISLYNVKGKLLRSKRSKIRGKHVKNIKVEFAIANNSSAKHCNRKLYLSIINPKGVILSEGSNETPSYTCAQNFQFTNSNHKLNFVYKPVENLIPGKYTIALFNDEHKMGEEFIYLK